MKLSRHHILGGINFAISIGFFQMLISIAMNTTDSSIYLYLSPFVVTILTNALLAYQVLYKKTPIKFSYWLALTITSSIIWYVMYFLISFFATIPMVLGMTIVVLAIFYVLKKTSLRVASITAAFTLLIVLVSFATGFEETYCVEKGNQAELVAGGDSMVNATAEDVKLIADGQNFSFEVGDQIGLNFREHFRCHSTFDFKEAILRSLTLK